LQPVINATGVLIHTNLGRVPLGPRQIEAVQAVAMGYSNLEYDVSTGRRGSRYSHAGALLTQLTGAEAALVVNNNAAAVLVTLAALCGGREVVISRGELIEIGGEFRIPEVMSSSGARLVEVGATNRTHLADYERAITPETAAILKVHPSNYRVVGFTASVEARELARLSRGRGVCFIHDVGSGLVAPGTAEWTREEPSVSDSIEDGADIVTFSGDKLFGGPQAGVIAGRRDLVTKIERHPLMRALRVDKMTLAALEATALMHLRGETAEVPLWAMALTGSDELERRCRALAERLETAVGAGGAKLEVVATEAVTGGGSLPGQTLPSWGLSIVHPELSSDEVARRLRRREPPVIVRVEDDRVVADLRTVPAEADPGLADALIAALS
jgi:L-seryl-tRNA(Ser) seleniumtransferase